MAVGELSSRLSGPIGHLDWVEGRGQHLTFVYVFCSGHGEGGVPVFGALHPSPPAAASSYFPLLLLLLLGAVAAAALLKNNSQPQSKQQEKEKTKQKLVEFPSHYPTSRVESIVPVVTEIKARCRQEEEIKTKPPVSAPSPPQLDIQATDTIDNDDDEETNGGERLSNCSKNSTTHDDENRNSDAKVQNGKIQISNGHEILMSGNGDVGSGEITVNNDNIILNGNNNKANGARNNNTSVTTEPNTANPEISKKDIPQIIIEPFIEPVKELFIEPVSETLRQSAKEYGRVLSKNKLEDQKMQISTEEEIEEPEYITKIKTFKITKWPKFNTADIVQYGPESLLEVLQVVQLQVRGKETNK